MKSKSLLVFLLALWASLAVHAWDFEEHLIGYNILNGTEVEVDRIIQSEIELYPDEFQNVTIPQQVSFHDVSYNVIGINANAFCNCSIPVSITLPEGLMTIGDNAFRGCSSLTNINLPESLTSIGNYAFYGCPNLTIMTIPEGLTSIGNYGFCGCSVPTSITIPESLTDIGDFAFSSCTNLNSITLPEGVTSIGEHTFYRCSSLTSITLPESLTNIGNNAFHCCSSLTSITLPKNLTTIGNYAFGACSSLANINLPEGLTSIGESAFAGCSSLTNIIIPEGLTSIEKHTFHGCTNLTSITLPKTLTSIEIRSFEFCSNLTNINLPAGLTSIGDCAFFRCSSLTSITLPKGLTSIGEGAFWNCSSLTSVNAQIQEPFSIRSIDFSSISSNCVLTVPAGTRDAYIAKGWTTDVFKGGIVEIAAPNIDFADANVKAICVAHWDNDHDGELSYEEAAAVTSLSDFFMNDEYGVREVMTSFDELQYFTGLTNINAWAFLNCYNLTSVTLPNTIREIEDYAFQGCSSLSSITFPEGLTEIGKEAFEYSGLTSVKFPSTLEDVRDAAFLGCDNLSSIDFNNAPAVLHPHAFTLCPSLEYVYIPKTVQLRGWGHFYICENLKTVVSEANDQADWWATGSFDLCPALETISVPNVRSMGGNFVGTGESLQSVTILGGDAPDNWQHYANKMGSIPPSRYLKFNIPDGMAESFLKHGYANLSDLSALPIVKEEFEAEATRIMAMATAIANGDAGTLTAAITAARTAVNAAEDYVSVYDQIAAIKAAARAYLATATLPEGTDVAAATITNPDINRYDIGWTISGGDNTRGYNESSYTNGVVTVDGFIEAWHEVDVLEDGEIWQTLPDLPAGRYRLEVDAIACQQMDGTTEVTGVSLFAGNESRPIATEADKPQSFFLEFENPFQKDVRIGVRTRNTTANWIAVDNFRLIYIGSSNLYLPESITPTSSETDLVYLYNVETGKFLHAGNSLGGYHAVLADTGLPFHLTQNGDGYWLFYFPEGSRFDQYLYWACNNAKIYVDYDNSGEWTRQWLFTETDGAYTLQFREQEGSDYFLGNNPARKDYDYDYEVELDSHVDVICTDDVSNNIHWLLFSEEQYQRFMTVDELSVPDVRGVAGGKVNLPVSLSNPKNEVAGVQFEVTLPEGVTLNKVSTAGRTSAFSTGFTRTGDGVYTVLLYHGNDAIPENDGKILTLELQLDGGMANADYPISIREIVLSAPDQSVLSTSNAVSSVLTVADPDRGDANSDGRVNVADIVAIANYILNNPSARFNATAADVNNDTRVNVADIVGVANLILSAGGNSPRMVSRNEREPE